MHKTKFFGLIIGIIFLMIACLLPSPESLNSKAWLTLGVAMLMATWWLTEVIPTILYSSITGQCYYQ